MYKRQGLGVVRIELKVANPVGIIYECYIMAGESYFSDQAVVSFRILYEKDLDRISLDVVDIPGRSSLSNYLQLLEIFEGLQNYLNREFAKVKNTGSFLPFVKSIKALSKKRDKTVTILRLLSYF